MERGAQVLIMGCTEIPIIFENENFEVSLIDPNRVISRVAVAFAIK
jgi:aspartate racemase